MAGDQVDNPEIVGDQVDASDDAALDDRASRNSVQRERIIEHIFVADVLRRMWQRGIVDVEVLRSEFDAGGYDLVIAFRGITRHIQLKTSIVGGKTRRQTVGLRLMEKPSGCVIWIVATPELHPQHYLWFGNAAGEPLPDISRAKIAKHTKANMERTKAERPQHRTIPLSAFVLVPSLDQLLFKLFGPLEI